MLNKMSLILVALMAILQGLYGVYAYVDPTGFAALRGTELATSEDIDWVIIYGSRTIFVSLTVALLLVYKQFNILMWVALIGVVMPVTDAWLAFQAGAPNPVVLKHVATVIYLLITFAVLKALVKQQKSGWV